jgi:hypothetical protein
VGHIARIRETRNLYKIFVGKPEGTGLFGRPRRKREDNITEDLREIKWEVVYWIRLAQNRPLAGSCEHGNESSSPIKCRKFLDLLSDH